MLHDKQAAEDAVQEASFTAWSKLGRLQDRGRLRPWFLGVVANKCRNARRRTWSSDVSLGVPEDAGSIRGRRRSANSRSLSARSPDDLMPATRCMSHLYLSPAVPFVGVG